MADTAKPPTTNVTPTNNTQNKKTTFRRIESMCDSILRSNSTVSLSIQLPPILKQMTATRIAPNRNTPPRKKQTGPTASRNDRPLSHNLRPLWCRDRLPLLTCRRQGRKRDSEHISCRESI